MKEIIDCLLPEKLLNLGLVLKNAVFLHNYINITLRKLITELYTVWHSMSLLYLNLQSQSYTPWLNCLS